MAADLNIHLDNLSKTLTQMIESVNSLTAPTHKTSTTNADNASLDDQGAEDPLNQIGAVLNAHLKSLYWIDSTVKEVETKVTEAEARVKEVAGGRVNSSNRKLGVSSLGGSMTRESSSGGVPLGQFGSMSLRGSEGPRQRGFGLKSSQLKP